MNIPPVPQSWSPRPVRNEIVRQCSSAAADRKSYQWFVCISAPSAWCHQIRIVHIYLATCRNAHIGRVSETVQVPRHCSHYRSHTQVCHCCPICFPISFSQLMSHSRSHHLQSQRTPASTVLLLALITLSQFRFLPRNPIINPSRAHVHCRSHRSWGPVPYPGHSCSMAQTHDSPVRFILMETMSMRCAARRD